MHAMCGPLSIDLYFWLDYDHLFSGSILGDNRQGASDIVEEKMSFSENEKSNLDAQQLQQGLQMLQAVKIII